MGVNLKTGNILRKLGYDRGRFIVRYNFLRKIAGSYETILVDDENKIWNDSYHVMDDGTIMDGESHDVSTQKKLFLKENKYIVHEISPSRTEVRLIPQNINDSTYKQNLVRTSKQRIVKDLDNTVEFLNKSENDKVLESTDVLPQSYVGSLFYIKDYFVESYKNLPSTDEQSAGLEEVIGETIQAKFRVSDYDSQPIKGSPQNILNLFSEFSSLQSDDEIQRKRDEFEKEPGRKGRENQIIQFSPGSVVTLKSISTKPSTQSVKYNWKLSGFDMGLRSGSNNKVVWTKRVTSQEVFIEESGGLKHEDISTSGNEINVNLSTNDLRISVQLTIETKLGQDDVKSTIFLPLILETSR
tara:strand:- start:613 stop:1677 length:1065 start_codon:yes stop_codon:yes gene_type:complete